MTFHAEILIFALALCATSAYPFTAMIGTKRLPSQRLISALTAFGGGILFFSFIIETADLAFSHVNHWLVLAGCLGGGLLFETLSQFLNVRGGFLRKTATMLRHLTHQKRGESESIIEHLSRIVILEALPPDEMARLVPHIQTLTVPAGFHVFEEGDYADSIYLIGSGRCEIVRENVTVTSLGVGECFGEMALITGAPRNATIITTEDCILYRITKADFERLLQVSPETRAKVDWLIATRSEDLINRAMVPEEVAEKWQDSAFLALRNLDFLPTHLEAHDAAREHGEAPTGVLLGNVLDTVPPLVFLGMNAAGEGRFSWGLWTGILLAAIPDTLSNCRVMHMLGTSRIRVLVMWGAIMLLGSSAAALGWSVRMGMPEQLGIFTEGIAGGATLAMIIHTVLPEAYQQSSSVETLCTFLGFIAALLLAMVG